MMNQFAMSQSGLSGRDEIRGPVPISDRPVACPKPRRLGFHYFNDQSVRSLRWHLSHQAELCDSKPPADLLDFILTKGGGGGGFEQLGSNSQVVASSSPPFFCGSPPSRVANPLIQDARFEDERFSPLSPSGGGVFSSPPSGSPSSSARKAGSCVRANFGNSPAVRVEGFDCLDRDRRNRSIPTWA